MAGVAPERAIGLLPDMERAVVIEPDSMGRAPAKAGCYLQASQHTSGRATHSLGEPVNSASEQERRIPAEGAVAVASSRGQAIEWMVASAISDMISSR